MNGKNDLMNDILPMVVNDILDPEYLTGEKKKGPSQDDSDQEDKDSDKEGA